MLGEAHVIEALGQAEIGQLRRPDRGRQANEDRRAGRSTGPCPARDDVGTDRLEQDVGRLEVAVEDPLLVGAINGPGQGLDQRGGRYGPAAAGPGRPAASVGPSTSSMLK